MNPVADDSSPMVRNKYQERHGDLIGDLVSSSAVEISILYWYARFTRFHFLGIGSLLPVMHNLFGIFWCWSLLNCGQSSWQPRAQTSHRPRHSNDKCSFPLYRTNLTICILSLELSLYVWFSGADCQFCNLFGSLVLFWCWTYNVWTTTCSHEI
jgi:hypothetical protein